jgi:hypothetical protein
MESGELAARLAGEERLMITGSAAEILYRRLVELRGADGLLRDAACVPCDPLGLLEVGLSLGSEAAEELHPLYLRKSEAVLKRDGA